MAGSASGTGGAVQACSPVPALDPSQMIGRPQQYVQIGGPSAGNYQNAQQGAQYLQESRKP